MSGEADLKAAEGSQGDEPAKKGGTIHTWFYIHHWDSQCPEHQSQKVTAKAGDFAISFDRNNSKLFVLKIRKPGIDRRWDGVVIVQAFRENVGCVPLSKNPFMIVISPHYPEVKISLGWQRDWGNSYVSSNGSVCLSITITDAPLYMNPVNPLSVKTPGFAAPLVPGLNPCLQLLFCIPRFRKLALDARHEATTLGTIGAFFMAALQSKLAETFEVSDAPEFQGLKPHKNMRRILRRILDEEDSPELAKLFGLQANYEGRGEITHYLMKNETRDEINKEQNMLIHAPYIMFVKLEQDKKVPDDVYKVDGTEYHLHGLVVRLEDSEFLTFVKLQSGGYWLKYFDEYVATVAGDDMIDGNYERPELAMYVRDEERILVYLHQVEIPKIVKEDAATTQETMTVHVRLPKDLQKNVVFGKLEYRDANRTFMVPREMSGKDMYWAMKCFLRIFDREFNIWVYNDYGQLELLGEDDDAEFTSPELWALVQYIYPDQEDVSFFISVCSFLPRRLPLSYLFTLPIDDERPAEDIVKAFFHYTLGSEPAQSSAQLYVRRHDRDSFCLVEDLRVSIDQLGISCGDVVVVGYRDGTIAEIPDEKFTPEMQNYYILNRHQIMTNLDSLESFLSKAQNAITITRHLHGESASLIIPCAVTVSDFAVFARCGVSSSHLAHIDCPIVFKRDQIKPISSPETKRVGDVFRDGDDVELYHSVAVSSEFFKDCVRLIVETRQSEKREYVQVFPGRLTVRDLIIRAARKGWIWAADDIENTPEWYRVIQMERETRVFEYIIPYDSLLSDIDHNPLCIQRIPEDQRRIDRQKEIVALLYIRYEHGVEADYFKFIENEPLWKMKERVGCQAHIDIDKWTLEMRHEETMIEPQECDCVFDLVVQGFKPTLVLAPEEGGFDGVEVGLGIDNSSL